MSSVTAVTLGLVVAPLTVFATNTTNVSANIGSTISVSNSTPTVNLNITPTASGSASSASDAVTVTTNNTNGYKLSIQGATTTLANGANTLSADTGTPAAPAAITTGTWGYRWDDSGSGGTSFAAGPTTAETNVASLTSTKWAGMTTSPVQIKNTTTAATSGDTTTIWYGAKADTSKPSGAYTDTVTYTAAVNP